ncbi:G-type lectin S-receptor-like serine/threonine-protein kinase At4g03230 isoform X2 [Apium graveolens]|uniref:G-type lectin S-receptor-like serine/threonine-protein kinase At4g03230 isoform X2 n=1 Tax=Apium graveolens TaxID=4045 RepID=UPI003D7ABD67
MPNVICFLCTFLLSVFHFQYFCVGIRDTLKLGDWIHDGGDEKIVSAGSIFQLGFFTPSGNTDGGRYFGIWYFNSPEVVVWVANRTNPIPFRVFGTFGINMTSGNLEVSNSGSTFTYFSTNLTHSPKSRPYLSTAKLYDSGNLVLTDDRTSATLWESFDHPTDTFLLGMKMDKNLNLTSWKSDKDPAPGDFSFRSDGVYRKNKLPYWKIEGESANSFIPNEGNKISAAVLSLISCTNNTSPKAESKGWLYGNDTSCSKVFDSNSRLRMGYNGEIKFLKWDINYTRWRVLWVEPQGCSVYNACGSFSECKPGSGNYTCNCLPGYEPANDNDGKSGDFSGGCKEIVSSKCTRDNTTSFDVILVTKVRSNTPHFEKGSSDDDCKRVCQENCSCQAYSYRSQNTDYYGKTHSSGCWYWYGDLIDIQEGSTDGAHNIQFRHDPPSKIGQDLKHNPNPNPNPTGNQKRKMKSSTLRTVIIATSVIFAVALLCSITCISYRRVVAKGKDQKIIKNQAPRLYDTEYLMAQDDQFREDDKKDIDVPFFELESIVAATDNFSQAHKLGQGGFGPVYKGKFPDGAEIAVKRLSSNSGQGLMEFKNEVVLIAKLQHWNLVRLLGYCIKGNEKILLYECMPNKSLDAFLFDEKLRMLLNWATRFDIIVGVARGLLYLHQDSRLRIIHRDMKASNILLDEEMNPKISDFGLARIVGRRETESNTTRVIGTYGYMAPEYALEGQFSVKSDAFSFGIVVLEIISGKKISGFFDSQLGLGLLGYAWNLWKEEKPMTLLDETLVGSCNNSEVLKCITIGLLCVQEDPNDRPDMSKVVFMLSGETETLPNPKQPAFVTRKHFSGTTSSSSTKPEMLTENEITFTEADGR